MVSSARGRAGTAVLRNLGRGGYDAIGADYGPPPFGLRSRWSSGYRILPRPSNSEALLEALENAGVEAVLPLESRLVGLLATHREQLRKRLGLAVPDRQGFLTAYDKRRTVEACGRLGIPAPRILDGPPRPGEVVVVKPRADIGAAQGVAFCRNDAEMAIALTSCRRFGEPLLQEYVPGGVDAMRTVVLLFDRRCRLVAWFTMRKLAQYPVTGGMTTMAVSTDEPQLVALVLPLFQTYRWEGPAEVELKIDARNGQARVIEINPRLPAYLAFAIRCGLQLPRLCARVALGESPNAEPYVVGRRYVHPILHAKAALTGQRRWHERLLGLSRAVLDMRGAILGDGLNLIDPAPRLAKTIAEWRGDLRPVTNAWPPLPSDPDEIICSPAEP